MKNILIMWGLFIFVSMPVFGQENAEEIPRNYTVAVMNFTERGAGVKDNGGQVSQLLFANLVSNPNLWMVEREDLNKVLEESELNLSGAVNPQQAIQVGQLTGAQIIITGSVFKVSNKTYLVAKIISTETSRVLGESSNGTDLEELSKELSGKINKLFENKVAKLMPKEKSAEDMFASLKEKLGDAKRPSLYISISEKHLGRESKDPAAQTELMLLCKKLGFEITDNKSQADLIVSGEGFSEFATSRQKLISVKARLEVKVLDKKGKVVAVDRQTAIAIDLAEMVAGKKALQNAAAKIGERILPKLIKK